MRITHYAITRAVGIGWPIVLLPGAVLVGAGEPGGIVRYATAAVAFGGAYSVTYGACWALGCGPGRAAFYAGAGCLSALLVLRLALAPLAGH